MMRRSWSVLLLGACLIQPGQALSGESLGLPPRDRLEVYELLRGRPNPDHGYLFTVSPDEQWIALLRPRSSGQDYRLTVLNRRTGRAWDYSPPETEWLLRDWLPNCFSADSKRIAFADRVAVLSPTMAALDFQVPGSRPDLVKFEGTALGYSAIPQPRRAPTGRERWMPSREEKDADLMARSADGKVLYESLVKGQVKSSYLRLTPPGRDVHVDYAQLFDVVNRETRSFSEKFFTATKEQQETMPPAQLEAMQGLKAMFGDIDDSKAPVKLSDLSISPNQRFLAGTATLYRGDSGDSFGVVIPLDRGGHAAYPFAKEVHGKAFWSADSSAIYFYAQQPTGGGNGTVHRFVVSNLGLPARIPEKELSGDKLLAPSDTEIQMAKYQKTKETHYEILKAEYAKPLVILEFKGRWGYTEAGYTIELYGADETRNAALEQFVTANLLHRPLRFRLPERDEFLRNYIPETRTGFGDPTKYPWRQGGDASFGTVPVLLYDDDGLVNSRFQTRNTLEKYK